MSVDIINSERVETVVKTGAPLVTVIVYVVSGSDRKPAFMFLTTMVMVFSPIESGIGAEVASNQLNLKSVPVPTQTPFTNIR